jgi:predicted membrane-bound mannosyltransferase
MNPKTSARVLIIVSVCYGLLIAILGAVGSSAVALVAMIGALVIGALWVVRGILINRGRST